MAHTAGFLRPLSGVKCNIIRPVPWPEKVGWSRIERVLNMDAKSRVVNLYGTPQGGRSSESAASGSIEIPPLSSNF